MNEVLNWLGDHPAIVWVGIAVVLAVLELLSMDLVLLMFAIGALGAAIVAALSSPLWAGLLVFAVVSAAMLAFARPKIARKLHDGPELSTGYAQISGTTALVLERVTVYGGRVRAMNEVWTARAKDETEELEPNTEAEVVRIEGASLIVTRKVN